MHWNRERGWGFSVETGSEGDGIIDGMVSELNNRNKEKKFDSCTSQDINKKIPGNLAFKAVNIFNQNSIRFSFIMAH